MHSLERQKLTGIRVQTHHLFFIELFSVPTLMFKVFMFKVLRHTSKCPFLWDVTPCHWIIGARRFERPLWFYLQVSKWYSSCTFQPLKMRLPCCLDTSGASHAAPLRHIPEERRNQLYRCPSLNMHSYSRITSTKSP
jgi:hypothetical protein